MHNSEDGHLLCFQIFQAVSEEPSDNSVVWKAVEEKCKDESLQVHRFVPLFLVFTRGLYAGTVCDQHDSLLPLNIIIRYEVTFYI